MRILRHGLAPALLLAVPAAFAQAPAATPQPQPQAQPQPGELKRLCAALPPAPPFAASDMAHRAECVLSGLLPAADRIGEARTYARAAMQQGEPSGGLLLYLAFQYDPANQTVRDGRFDADAYRRLAARSLPERKQQVEAIEGLGFAAGANHRAAGVLLASYFHDTVAPGNVTRVATLTAMLKRNGEDNPLLERYARESEAIAQGNASGTHASARGFFEAYREASRAAAAGYGEQAAGGTCADLPLKSVSAGEIEGAEFLPLTGKLVAQTYLVQGRWSEFWTFRGCGHEVPVKVAFAADGWGGTTARATYNKGN